MSVICPVRSHLLIASCHVFLLSRVQEQTGAFLIWLLVIIKLAEKK